MKYIKYLIPMIVLSLFIFTGCSSDDDDPEVKGTFETLSTYLVENGMDLTDVIPIDGSWITTAETIQGLGRSLDEYYIMDIRGEDVYNQCHIPGAVNSSLSNILADAANSGGVPILVACYSGQSAGHAVVALRLSGYLDAKVLKWGMSSWRIDFDSWSANTASIAIGDDGWTPPPGVITPSAEFDLPDWESNETDGAALLAERVSAMLAGGFKGVLGADVLAAPENYFINNYWAEADVTTYGNLDGAYRIKEDLNLASEGFKYLDASETVVTYCWTGQTSSMVTAYLTVLGYDAKSLQNGVNSLIYDNLTAHEWSPLTVEYDCHE